MIAFVVNGDADSAMAARAQAFAARLPEWLRPVVFYRTGSRVASVRHFRRALRRARPRLIYVFDVALAGVIAATAQHVAKRTRIVVDTGDAVTALARSSGRHLPGVVATAALERLALGVASHVVVRGSAHHELLTGRGYPSTCIQDGVDLSVFRPMDGSAVRRELGLGDDLAVAVLGSSVWNPRLRMAYGWDLVEALGLLRGLPVRGLVIGDGSGIPALLARARELGVQDRLVLVGRRPLTALPPLLCASDVCLSTQTNDIVGRVRTTGKLPLYLGCGRHVLASNVGEASRVLPPDMLLEYRSAGRDDTYPGRLAERLRELVANRDTRAISERGLAVARAHFDYDLLAPRLHHVLGAHLS